MNTAIGIAIFALIACIYGSAAVWLLLAFWYWRAFSDYRRAWLAAIVVALAFLGMLAPALFGVGG